jgi:hypothetical protein
MNKIQAKTSWERERHGNIVFALLDTEELGQLFWLRIIRGLRSRIDTEYGRVSI